MLKELNYVIITQLILNGITEKQMIKASDKIQDIFWRCHRINQKTFSNLCSEDQSDSKFIDCAIDARVEYIISEDGHLNPDLSQHVKSKYNHSVEILSAYQFITRILLSNRLKGKFSS